MRARWGRYRGAKFPGLDGRAATAVHAIAGNMQPHVSVNALQLSLTASSGDAEISIDNGQHEVREGNGRECVAETYMLIWRTSEHAVCPLGVSGADRDGLRNPEAEVVGGGKFGRMNGRRSEPRALTNHAARAWQPPP